MRRSSRAPVSLSESKNTYDPDTGQFGANLVQSSKPVVTSWDPSMPATEERQVGNWEVTPTRDGVSALTGEGAELEVPENVQADLRKRAEQEGGSASASAFVHFSHDLVTRETDSRVNVPMENGEERVA